MNQFLLDTNICIYFLKGQFQLDQKIASAGLENCFISEITVAELKFGAEKSKRKNENREVISRFVNSISILPIFNALDIYATEKARLQSSGKPLDDFDLLIGATAKANDLILVTRNTKHFDRLEKIKIENWVEA